MVYAVRRRVVYRMKRGAAALALLLGMACTSSTTVVRTVEPEEPTREPTEARPTEGKPAEPSPGSPALISAGELSIPDASVALGSDRAGLLKALDRSLGWFERPSSRDRFPMYGISHSRAWASVYAFRQLVRDYESPGEFKRRVEAEFDFYTSIGSDGRGTVLYTGYYSPTFEGSRVRTASFPHPLYRLPEDLVKDPATGETLGQRVGESITPYPERAEIERSGMLAGTELVWLRSQWDAYLVHVQGSAALSLTDGTTLHIGYAGNNGHPYVSPARELVADGKISEAELSLDEVKAYFESHPDDVDTYLRRNPRFIFFREEKSSNWPLGSLGVPVTPLRTIATDKELFPPGGVTLVMTRATDASGRSRPFQQFMLDQDRGGAILSPGRVDIYFGIGAQAERRAGDEYFEGRLYYLFLKPQRLGVWEQRAGLDF